MKKNKQKDDFRLNIRIKSDFKQRLIDAAEKENRTLTSFVMNAVKLYLQTVDATTIK